MIINNCTIIIKIREIEMLWETYFEYAITLLKKLDPLLIVHAYLLEANLVAFEGVDLL